MSTLPNIFNHWCQPEALHPSVYIREEMKARGWNEAMTARYMRRNDHATARAILHMYLTEGPTDKTLRINAYDFARAFGTTPEFWNNLEAEWLRKKGW